MGFKQTPNHVSGRGSFHQVGVSMGQLLADYSFDKLLPVLGNSEGLDDKSKALNLDHVELAGWTLDLPRAVNPEGAKAVASEVLAKCQKFGLDIVSIAGHLPGQVLGDTPSAATLNFQGGDPVDAYKEWRRTNRPPSDDPYFVPDEVAKLMREKAIADLGAIGRVAFHLGDLQNRRVPVSFFTGAPCRVWDHHFPFPGRPTKVAGLPLLNEGESLIDRALKVVIERMGPVWELYRKYPVEQTGDPDTKPVMGGLEDHPTEVAIGDIVSAHRFIEAVHKAGHTNVGFNYDPSHKAWNDVDYIAYIYELAAHIIAIHFKGVINRALAGPTRAGRMGGYVDFGSDDRTMDFVYAGCQRDVIQQERIVVALNKVGFDGGFTLEVEDNDFELLWCLRRAAENLRRIDGPPSRGAFDRAFAQ